MKKYLYLSLLCMTLFMACTSKEEKLKQQNEKAAIECVKWTLKCPSTMEVSSVTQVATEAQVERDTLYHIKKKHGKYTNYGSGLKFWDKVDAVTVDSIKEFIRSYPAYTMCFVSYDAQNSYGAMIRENQSVAIQENGEAMLFDDFFSKYYDKAEVNVFAVEPIKYSNISDKLIYTDEGKWVTAEELFGIEPELVMPVGME